jgi:DNA-binding XRE family transcriptional regulator
MNKVIIDNLEQIRTKNNINKTAMAGLMGITRQTYDKRLKGAELKWDEMANLRLKLNINLNDLVLQEAKFDEYPIMHLRQPLKELFDDFLIYDIHPNKLRELILQKIFKKYFSKKSLYEKLIQNNRAICDFAMILEVKDTSFIKSKQNTAKEILIKKIKNAKIKTSEKRVKKNILDKIKLLSDKDCYYILNFSDLAIKTLLQYIPKSDHTILNNIGYKTFLDKYINENTEI